MATDLFDLAAEKLEDGTDLDRLAARGTLRLALKEAGLDADHVTIPQLQVVFERLMPKELTARGVDDATSTCKLVMFDITDAAGTMGLATPRSPDEILERLGGD